MAHELSFFPTTGLSLTHTHLLVLSYIYMLVAKSMLFVILIKIKYLQLASHVGCRKNCAAKDDLPTQLVGFFLFINSRDLETEVGKLSLATCFFLFHMPGLRRSHYYFLTIYMNHLQELALHI